jgi:hypothetical protein
MAVPKKFKYKKVKKNCLKLKKNLYLNIKFFRESEQIIDYIVKYYI